MRPRMPIAALRRRLQLEAPVETPDDSGGFSRVWQVVADVWVSIETLDAAERFVAQRGEMRTTHRIAMRWRPDITGAMRLRSGSRAFRILTASDADTHRRFLVCHCEETTS